MTPDSQETSWPGAAASQTGRTKKRRMKRPAMRDGAEQGEDGGEVEIDAAEAACGVEEADAEAGGDSG